MTTYADVQNQISLELRGYDLAADTGIVGAIKSSILWAIKHHEHRLFPFNEEISTSVTTSGVERYALPNNYISLLGVSYSNLSNSQSDTLERINDSVLDKMNTANYKGMPRRYSISNRLLRLSPIPDNQYIIYLDYIKSFPLPVHDTDESVWFNEAKDLIVFTASYRLAAITFKETETANLLRSMMQDEIDVLEQKTLGARDQGSLVPWGI